MSRREARESDSRRHRSRFDREPSPKRSRRDGKPETERMHKDPNLDGGDHSVRDQKHQRRLQDALPLEVSSAPDSKLETQAVSKVPDKISDGHREGTKHSSDPAEMPRSRSYFQHDERESAGQVGRSFSRKTTECGWWRDLKDEKNDERTTNKTTTIDTQRKNEKTLGRGGDTRAWRHDGYFKIKGESNPPPRRRPPFSEKKISIDSKKSDKAGADAAKPNRPERRDDRGIGGGGGGGYSSRHSDQLEKPFSGDREIRRGSQRDGFFPSRDRYSGGGNRFAAIQGYYRPSGTRVEKWKHDLYDEANRSPTPKNEEDQIAKVEALLSS